MRDRREPVFMISATAIRRVLMFFVLVALIVVGAAVFQQRDKVFGRPLSAEIDASSYQAVFLTGGQVYFGKLSAVGDHYLLGDVFYLASSDAGSSAAGQLIKRGQELHGPREPMVILNASILFIENLRDEGTVATAIRKFKAGEIPTATPPPPTVAPTATVRPSASR